MKELILIADSGSTKTDWAIGQTIVKTQGINPVLQDDETILDILHNELCPNLRGAQSARLLLDNATSLVEEISNIKSIRFYGAGVRPELEAKMVRLLRQVFPMAESIEAKSDMLGAARALCGDKEGLACILGTGANSCLYDGEHIIANTPALGYILGDEGSGAVLGRSFLNAIYKKNMLASARVDFEQHFNITMADVVRRVYREPLPNRWLASLSEYIHTLIAEPWINDLVVENFQAFIKHNIASYQRPDLPLNALGSIAYYYESQLRQAARIEGYTVGRIMRSPLEELGVTS